VGNTDGLTSGQASETTLAATWPTQGFALWWLEAGILESRARATRLSRGAWGVAEGSPAPPWNLANSSAVSLRWFGIGTERAWSSRASAWLWRTAKLNPVVSMQPLSFPRTTWWAEAAADLTAGNLDAAVWLEIEALLWRLERDLPVATLRAGVTAPLESAGLNQADARAASMVRYITRHAQESLTVEDICRSAGLPATHGASLFRRATGLPILTYLRRVRVALACELLVGTRRKVLDIALASGFGTASRFYEAFTREAGCSPQDYRSRAARSGESTDSLAARWARRPARPPAENLAASIERPASQTTTHPGSPVVLWVDDVPANNFEERLFLHEIGVFTDCHLDNASALLALATRQHALVISDLNRPPGQPDGWDLLANLRAAGDETPVLFYTGALDEPLEKRVNAAGAQGVFTRSRPLVDRLLEVLAQRLPAGSAAPHGTS
jgi:AraC-like DNA-binding protein/CheY-like chemotaxis protein